MMPFGLKNAGTTYMRAMTTMLHDMINKEIEVYVDDVIIKSKKAADHIADLRKFFDRLRRYNLKLNPTKCAFGVPAGKLLGFIVSRRGIKLDPSKIKAIQELAPPKSKKRCDELPRTMDPLKYIFQKLMPIRKLAKWLMLLSEFDIVYVTQKVVKGKALATHLAENLRMFFDGVANFKGVGIGAVLVSEMGQHYPVSAKLRFSCTNNMAEYEACILGLNMAIKMNIQELLVVSDSNLLVHQSAYCAHIEEETDGKPWFHDIKEYLSKGEYPEHANHTQKRTLRRLSNHLFHREGNLYRRTPDLGLLRCVDAKEASKLLEDVHARTYGPYMNGFVLAKKILRAAIDYFTKWVETASYKAVTKKVIADFVKDCIVCRFRVPESIISDNAANLNTDLMKSIYCPSSQCSSLLEGVDREDLQTDAIFRARMAQALEGHMGGFPKTIELRPLGRDENLSSLIEPSALGKPEVVTESTKSRVPDSDSLYQLRDYPKDDDLEFMAHESTLDEKEKSATERDVHKVDPLVARGSNGEMEATVSREAAPVLKEVASVIDIMEKPSYTNSMLEEAQEGKEKSNEVQEKVDFIDRLRAEIDEVKAVIEAWRGRMDLLSLEKEVAKAEPAFARDQLRVAKDKANKWSRKMMNSRRS
ncbi:uncharacterized protein [Nicotiana sylvestris]|uniref:uncharacterized protein n=1 Tax=Nicotiana sylvestris TaxID=4096 RepID=UPI00388CDBB5